MPSEDIYYLKPISSSGRRNYLCFVRPRSPTRFVLAKHHCNHEESDDAFCRRKDRYYERLSDELAATKKQQGLVKQMKGTAREPRELRKLKNQYEELCDEVEVLEKKVEDEKKSVLRMYR